MAAYDRPSDSTMDQPLFEATDPGLGTGRHEAPGGWIKIWRQVRNNSLFQSLTDRERSVFFAILLMANWRSVPWFCRQINKEVVIPRGGFVSTQVEIGREANTTRKVVRQTIQRLTGGGFLRVRPVEEFVATTSEGGEMGAPKGSARVRRRVTVYVIENYAKWQDGGHSGATSGPQPGHREALIKEDKEDQKQEEKIAKARKPRASKLPPCPDKELAAEAWETARLHRDLLLSLDPQHSAGGKRWQERRWATTYDSFHRNGAANAVPWDLIQQVLRWALAPECDDFWHVRLNTPDALVKHWDTLRGQKNDASRGKRRDRNRPVPASQLTLTTDDYAADMDRLGYKEA